ncbi:MULTISPECIES: penicillin-binding protein 2 [Acinetobacter]|jgi:penicillin-binding protein 2|uniref:Peptidoglycan D,D-transpeptidase MrdA n=1 Tax=Acinetobacter johnsonii TaxID=40214 RepID=A0AAJ6LEF9_ACIJO|nr:MULTISPECIES: penicillin-binding protein 2 [Acinetobacter]ALV74508.1 penicillin-binding protein [Acinetobacter johnsonii XBB1]MBL4861168.1 penicillin-binding protein 2 [Acinetobacter sp.]MCV2452101.1 penicillin-binding protein 2 [Acinetobacter johnsonii]MDG9787853.1 penicillin-binding protein 2 [Acinetobacter johnsonii]MDG9799590.1 penicillin-binding protein 2 [Acinetobacter johnsonii]
MKQHFPLKNVQQEKRIFRNRTFISMGIVVFFLLILVTRYAYLQLVQFDEFSTASDQNRIRLQPLAPARGYIYDRNGVLLADNYPVFTATMSRADVTDIDATIERLTPILELTPDDIERFNSRIKASRKTERVSIKLNLNENDIARFSEVKYQFPGVNIETQMTRYYPHGELFAHVIGYVGRINDKELKSINKDLYAGTNLIGKIGVENSYEDLLHGVPGNESVEADAHGNVLRHLGRKEPVRGNDLYLSLDYGLQTVASEQLAGRRGAIVAMDPRTGEILALVSSPSFNPNLFVTGISHTDYSGLRDNLDQPLYNRAVQGAYPPGSTIKPMFGLGGIHYGLIDWGTAISDHGYFTLPGDSHKFRDWKKSGHGVVNLHKSQVVSCDTFFYILSFRMGIEKMNTWMRQFGFGEKTGVDLPSESTGLYPNPEWKMRTRDAKWLKGETISVSIGQGAFTATPLQLAMATAITANHGSHVIPHVLQTSKGAKPHKDLNAPDGRIQFNGTDQDWIQMRDAMVDVIETGTGRGIRTPMYKIAGKTGTAQVKSIAQGKRYNEALLTERQLDHGLFVGFAPAENPEIAIAVVWENGRHGGSAAQLARPILDYWLLTRHKNPIRPQNHQISGGLMTAGIKPGELPSGSTPPATTTGTSTATPTSTSNTAPASTTANTSRSATPPSAPVESD